MSILDEIRAQVKVDDRGCWVWQGRTDRDGYGLFWRDAKRYRVHRLVYELHNGSSPGTLSVCHECDNPSCCNPEHLWLGTNRENTHDAMMKGRLSSGVRHPKARLNEGLAAEILHRLSCGESMTDVARVLMVSTGAIQAITRGQTWKNVPRPKIHYPGKGVKGAKHYLAKLDEDAVREIRARRQAGEGPTAIARQFGVCPACIVNICNRKTWAHVE
jgi:hypothetical protein